MRRALLLVAVAEVRAVGALAGRVDALRCRRATGSAPGSAGFMARRRRDRRQRRDLPLQIADLVDVPLQALLVGLAELRVRRQLLQLAAHEIEHALARPQQRSPARAARPSRGRREVREQRVERVARADHRRRWASARRRSGSPCSEIMSRPYGADTAQVPADLHAVDERLERACCPAMAAGDDLIATWGPPATCRRASARPTAAATATRRGSRRGARPPARRRRWPWGCCSPETTLTSPFTGASGASADLRS